MDQFFLIIAAILLVLGLCTIREEQTAWLKILICLDAARHHMPCRFDQEWDINMGRVSLYTMTSVMFIGTGIGVALIPVLLL